MKTLILCGGKGTRAYPHTLELPKPLLHVAEQPILLHLMNIYAAQGFTDFMLAGGYRVDMLAEFAERLDTGWRVEVVDTGEDADTGERVVRCRERMGETFHLTYGDGLGDVDLVALVDFHRSHPGSLTVTTVPLPSQYGTLVLDGGGRVVEFEEKPVLSDHLINAGFFVVDQVAFDHWSTPSLERDVLPALSAAGELYAFTHRGFWKSMDTYKDALDLTELCTGRDAPWLARSVPAG
ncbi:MAG: sugar phosphate nucleotidyltransferase [Acidimicrobiales bacterium]